MRDRGFSLVGFTSSFRGLAILGCGFWVKTGFGYRLSAVLGLCLESILGYLTLVLD